MSRHLSDAMREWLRPEVRGLVREALRAELAALAQAGAITLHDPDLVDADLDRRFNVVPTPALPAPANLADGRAARATRRRGRR